VRRRSIRPQTVIPAQAGIYRSAARASDEWVPAFAGTVVDRRASRAGVLANIVAAPHRVGYRRFGPNGSRGGSGGECDGDGRKR
jgi:hypothetical protein